MTQAPLVAHMAAVHPYAQAPYGTNGAPFAYPQQPPSQQQQPQPSQQPHQLSAQVSSVPAPTYSFPPTDARQPSALGGSTGVLGQSPAAALPHTSGPSPLSHSSAPMQTTGLQSCIATPAPSIHAHGGGAPVGEPKQRSRPAAGGGRATPSSLLPGTDVQIEVGSGLTLGDVPLLVKRFEKVSNDDPRTKLLYTVCFPTFSGTIPDRTAKKSLRLFSGWASAEMRAAANVRLQEYANDVDLLRKVARLLDLSHEGSGDEVAARIESYLASPRVVVHLPKEETDAAGGAPTKKRRKPADKSEKKKRPPNPYLLFANEKREEVVRSKPDLQMMEVNRILGQLWASVPDAERQPYIDSAARLRQEWDRDHPEQAAAARAAGGSGSGRKKRRANNGAVVLDATIAEQPDAEIDDSDAMSDAAAAAAAAAGGRASSATPVIPSPHPVDHELAAQLQSSVVRFLSAVDLSRVTLRSVKTALTHEFSEKVVLQHSQLISNFVDAELMRI